MADINFELNNPQAVKLWAAKAAKEAIKKTYLNKFTGKDEDSLIQIFGDTNKSSGDRIRVPLEMALTGAGVSGDNTLEGNEEAITYYYDDLVINQKRHAVSVAGRMTEQRSLLPLRENARRRLQNWIAELLDYSLMNHLAGNTNADGSTLLKSNGNVAVTAPSSGNIIYHGAGAASDASLSTTATFTIDLLDKGKEKAETSTPMIRPLMIDGEEKYVCFMHNYQVYDMRVSSATTTGQWFDINKAALMGGEGSKNPIYTGALGEYNGIILHRSFRMPSMATNTRRAVLCGAQAGILAFGQESGLNKLTWVEEEKDYKNKFSVGAGLIYGLKKAVYNSADFATVVLATYAAAHS